MSKIIPSDCIIDTSLQVNGDLEVCENFLVRRNAVVRNDLKVLGNLQVQGILTTTVHQSITKYHYNYEGVPPNFWGRLKWLITGKLPPTIDNY